MRNQNPFLYPNMFSFKNKFFTFKTFKYLKINFNLYDLNHYLFIFFEKNFINFQLSF